MPLSCLIQVDFHPYRTIVLNFFELTDDFGKTKIQLD